MVVIRTRRTLQINQIPYLYSYLAMFECLIMLQMTMGPLFCLAVSGVPVLLVRLLCRRAELVLQPPHVNNVRHFLTFPVIHPSGLVWQPCGETVWARITKSSPLTGTIKLPH